MSLSPIQGVDRPWLMCLDRSWWRQEDGLLREIAGEDLLAQGANS